MQGGLAVGGMMAAGASAGVALGTVGGAIAVGMGAAWLGERVAGLIPPSFFLNLFGLTAMPPNPSEIPAVIGSDVFHSGSLRFQNSYCPSCHS